MGLTSYITIPIYFSMDIPTIFLTVKPYGVLIGFTMVYPIITGFTMSMIVTAIIFFSLWGIILNYAYFVNLLKDIRGYESFGEIKKAINATIHGSKRDKTMVALNMIAAIAATICFPIIGLVPLQIISALQTALTVIPIMTFALISVYLSQRYIKRRIVPKDHK
jgi:hypothetical protein